MGFFGIDDRVCARALVLVPLVAGVGVLSGCVSSPTYGTDKTANEQLLSDLNGALTLAPQKKPHIDYTPRPALVKPAPGEKETLPPPQESITASAEWPESPEQRRDRIRQYATEHRDDQNFEPQVINDVPASPAADESRDKLALDHPRPTAFSNGMSAKQRREEINRRLVERNQGDPTSRKYLSEPPVGYRQPSATAPQDDIGEDEVKKERRLKKEAAARSGKKSGMFDWLPW